MCIIICAKPRYASLLDMRNLQERAFQAFGAHAKRRGRTFRAIMVYFRVRRNYSLLGHIFHHVEKKNIIYPLLGRVMKILQLFYIYPRHPTRHPTIRNALENPLPTHTGIRRYPGDTCYSIALSASARERSASLRRPWASGGAFACD